MRARQQKHRRTHACPLPPLKDAHIDQPNTYAYLLSVPQLRLAQASHELHDRISGTPRYEALSELKEHCSIDLSKEWSLLSPAERLFKKPPRFGPRVNRREIDLTMPIPQVCSARSLSPGPDYRELSVSCARAAPRLHMLHYVTLGRVLGMRV